MWKMLLTKTAKTAIGKKTLLSYQSHLREEYLILQKKNFFLRNKTHLSEWRNNLRKLEKFNSKVLQKSKNLNIETLPENYYNTLWKKVYDETSTPRYSKYGIRGYPTTD